MMLLIRYTHLRAEDLVGRLGEHPMECMISGMRIIRKTVRPDASRVLEYLGGENSMKAVHAAG